MSERFYFRLRNKDDGMKVAEDVPAESGAEAIRLFKAQGIKPNPMSAAADTTYAGEAVELLADLAAELQ